jgi:hypothetical protein
MQQQSSYIVGALRLGWRAGRLSRRSTMVGWVRRRDVPRRRRRSCARKAKAAGRPSVVVVVRLGLCVAGLPAHTLGQFRPARPARLASRLGASSRWVGSLAHSSLRERSAHPNAAPRRASRPPFSVAPASFPTHGGGPTRAHSLCVDGTSGGSFHLVPAGAPAHLLNTAPIPKIVRLTSRDPPGKRSVARRKDACCCCAFSEPSRGARAIDVVVRLGEIARGFSRRRVMRRRQLHTSIVLLSGCVPPSGRGGGARHIRTTTSSRRQHNDDDSAAAEPRPSNSASLRTRRMSNPFLVTELYFAGPAILLVGGPIGLSTSHQRRGRGRR